MSLRKGMCVADLRVLQIFKHSFKETRIRENEKQGKLIQTPNTFN